MLLGRVPLSRLFTCICMGILFSIYAILCLRCTFRIVTQHITEKGLVCPGQAPIDCSDWSIPLPREGIVTSSRCVSCTAGFCVLATKMGMKEKVQKVQPFVLDLV